MFIILSLVKVKQREEGLSGFLDNSSSFVGVFQVNVSKELDDILKHENQDYHLTSICRGAFATYMIMNTHT